ncbi:MAG: ACP S-malonyltransferase [Thermodesulfobacteriota bacterium]
MVDSSSNLAVVFPGQGSQYIRMGLELYIDSPHAKEVFDEADEVLGFSLSNLCFKGPEERLNRTDITQPAILTVSIAAFRYLEARLSLTPSILAGHSLGEYSALVVSGALSFPDALRLVHTRGRLMQEAVPEGTGGMAAILGLNRALVEELCKIVNNYDGEFVVPANYNSPKQTVVSGRRESVERIVDMAKRNGAMRAVVLNVSVPSHSSWMIPAGEGLAKELDGIEMGDLNIPVITNIAAELLTDKGRVKDILVKQLSNPVMWEESMRRMASEGVNKVLEVGPGKVLYQLVRRIDKSLDSYRFERPSDLEKVTEFIEEKADDAE